MSAERDMTRIVRSWLRVDEHESPDRVFDKVFALLDATPQRPAWWPARRIADMNTFAKFAIAAAAVLIVAVIGYNLLPGRSGVGGGGPVASPSPSPTVSPSPVASPTPAGFPPRGEMAVGRHSITLEGVPFTFAVPSGWVSNGIFGIDKSTGIGPTGASFILWDDAPVGVFSDPCASVKAEPAGPSIADLAAALASIPGLDVVSPPTDVTVGGFPAKHVVVTVREDIDCPANEFMLWYAPPVELARYATRTGSTIRVWIIDVDGSIVWIDGETYKDAGPEPGQEVQAIIDSIQFE